MSVVHLESRLAPRAHWQQVHAGEHFVQFYDRDEVLIESLAGYCAAALGTGAAAIVVATAAHREAIATRLRAQGIDLRAALESGQYTALDARGTLSRLQMTGGKLSSRRFVALFDPLFSRAAQRFGRVCAFGEMVAILWQDGEREAVHALERFWNELRRQHPFTLFCAYPMSGFDAVAHDAPFAELCAHHSPVIPAESYSGHDAEQERLITICRLQQKAAALEREVERRQSLESELERRLAELAEAAQRKDEFLAMLGHELRNPLAPIRNIAEVLCRGEDRGLDFRPIHEMLARQVRQLTRLLDDLLDVARITQGKIPLQFESLELMAVLSNAIETCRPLISERGQHLTVTLPEDPVRVRGDRTRLVQVFANLLNNAVKYTHRGGHIAIRAERLDDRVHVRVRDDGIGIAPDVLPKVFELFAQAKRPLDRAEGGLGVGLTVVRTLLELHGGTVEAHSDGPGHGSEFVVDLPVYEDRHAVGPNVLPREAAWQARTPKRVVIVDDNRDSAESMAVLLRFAGHEIATVFDGRSALERIRALRPHLVLLDLGLPGMTGFEVVEGVRAFDRDVRIVAVTGYGQAADRERTRAAGFDDHLVKPVDPEALMALLA